jgi:IS5 family transposase
MIVKRVVPASQLGLGLNLSTKKTRKREFLDEMDRVVPWGALVQIVEPHSPRAKTGRPPLCHRGDAADSLLAAMVRAE